jgi:hypothetical protein
MLGLSVLSSLQAKIHRHCEPRLFGARQSLLAMPRRHCEPRRSNLGVVVIGNAMVAVMVKGVQREVPLAGIWGCPPAILIYPSP